MNKYMKHIFLSCLLFASYALAAGELDPITGILRTTSTYTVTAGTPTAEITVTAPAPGTAVDYNVLDLVALNFDHNSNLFLTNPASVLTRLTITKYDASYNIIGSPDTVSLAVYNDNRYNKETRDKSIYKTSNAYQLKVMIDEILVNGIIVPVLPTYVYIEPEIRITRYSSLSLTAPLMNGIDPLNTDCDGLGTIDELKLNWGTVSGAEEFQVEWTYVNDYGFTPTSSIAQGDLYADFKNNATRITTNGAFQEYRISLAYEKGYIAFRVRAVGRDPLDPTKFIYGNWTSGTSDLINLSALTSDELYYNIDEHEGKKNWQYSATFAEQGKKKEVISYFDGSLHNRQSVTKVNSDKNVIVGETIYDFQGRPAINVLPTPVNSPACTDTLAEEPALMYYENYNRNLAGNPYSKDNFDVDFSGQCAAFAPPMDTTFGSSQYYSGNNPFKRFHQAFVPNANMYPFSQVEYTPDNTGRIRAQSGVGKTFQLGSQHETKYIYSIPNQIQLDRLFGSEVGDIAHYKKNTVTDANGQISISYLNQEGKTIATSLAGNPPTDSLGVIYLEALESEALAAVPFTVDAFNKDINGNSLLNTITTLQDGIEFSTQLSVSYNSTYTFNYELNIDTLSDPCLDSVLNGYCISCIYDLEIKVTDECGVNLTPLGTATGDTIHKLVGHLDPTTNGFTMTCGSPTGTNDVEAITLNLIPGVYTVSKTLTINKDARDFYLEKYLDSTYNTCIKTNFDFVQAALAQVDTLSCYGSCDECLTALGLKEDFIAAGEGTEIQYDYLLERCLDPCKDRSLCEAAYEIMLVDVTPGGQYAQFDASTNTSSDKLSVLNVANNLNSNFATGGVGIFGNWKKPILILNGNTYTQYLDDLGQRVRVPVVVSSTSSSGFLPEVENITTLIFTDATDGSKYTYPENLKYLNDFIPLWNEYFARSLVIYHPEYAYYMACKDQSRLMSGDVRTADQFDSLLIATNGFNAAVTAKFIKSPSIFPTIPVPADRVFDWEVNAGPTGHMYDPIITDITNPGRFNDFRGPFGSTYNEVPGYVHLPLAAQMIAKINNYATINSVNYSMAEVAALIARCGNNFYATPTGNCINFGVDFINNPLTDPVIAQINDSIRDKEWENYKHFYIAEKRKLEYNRMNFFALHIVNSSDPAMPTSSILGGCNVCLGNPAFNPFLAGFYLGFGSFTILSPAYDVSQPCSFATRGFFENAQKRFIDPNNTGLGGGDVAYQIYQQTGQCPMAFQLHGFLNAMTQGHYLYPSATTSLNTISAFNPDMYDAINGGVSPSVYINYNWNVVSSVGGILAAQITDPSSGAVKCTFTLDITSTPIPDFTFIQSLQNLEFDFSSGGLDHFKVWASYNTTPGGPVTNVEIKGSSCIKINDCQFEPQCSPNVFAVDFMNVLNVMKANGLDLAPGYNMSSDPAIAPTLSTVIKNTLGTPNSALIWKFVTPNKVEIYDNANPTTKIVVTNLTSSVVGPGTVVAYANIKSNYNNLFKMDGIDASGNVILKINGKAEKITPIVTAGISMGECGLPTNPDCSLTEHIVRTDLEKLLEEFLTVHPFNGNVNLYSLASFSSLLQGYLPNTLTSTSSTYDFDSGVTTSYDTLIFNTSGACTFELYHNLNHLNSQPKNFGDLLSVDHLTGIPPFDVNQNYHNFYFVGTYTGSGSSTVTDTVWGTSCFPIKNCNACEPAPAVTPLPKAILDSMDVAAGKGLYEQNIPAYTKYYNTVDTLYTNLGWDSTNVNYVKAVDYSVYVDKGYINAPKYIKFVANFDTIVDSTQYLNIDKFIYEYGNLTNCTKEYKRYLRAVDAYNNRATALSEPLLTAMSDSSFYANNLCDTSYSYVKYLKDLPASSTITQTISQYYSISAATSIPDSCKTLYAQYLNVYKVFSSDPVVQAACKDANLLHPLYSFEAIEKNNLCCSYQGLSLFNDYINGLANASTGCPPMLQSLRDCSSPPDTDPKICERNYIYFISKINEYDSSAYATAHSHTLDPNIYPSFYLFQQANYCECVVNYINYLNDYISAPGTSTLPLPEDIDHYGGCIHTVPPIVEDTCKTLWASYNNAVTAYNNFVLKAHPGDPDYPLIRVIFKYDEFVEKYCHCAEKFIADLAAIVTGGVTSPELIADMTYLPNACEEPCLNSPSDTAFTFPPVPYSQNPCVAQMLNIAVQNANNLYNQYVDSVTTSFVTRYNEHCLHPEENLFYDYLDKEYHFTLYYYDQAGNLVKTIPPAGVEYLDIDSPTSLDEIRVKQDRFDNTKTIYTQHRMATTYEYNSLNQLVRQDMPDHDKMDICENLLPNGLDADLVINNVQFVSSNKGYLTGYLTRTIASTPIKRGYVYTTNDGGQNWVRVKGLAGANIQKVQFISATEGYAVADYGMVLKTLDGGLSWDVLTSLYKSPTSYFGNLYDLVFINPTTGIVGGIGKVYKTSNGGISFSTSSTGFIASDTITALTYDGSFYYATVINGAKGKFYRSNNGIAWTLQSSIAANMLKKVKFVNNTVAYAVGYDGTLLKSDAANGLWNLVPTNDPYKFSDVYFKDALNGVALVDSVVGLSRIYKTLDGGINWIALSDPGKYYSSLQMYDITLGKLIASGQNGLMSKVLMNSPPFGIMNAASTALSATTDDFTFTDAYLQPVSNDLISLGVTNTQRVYVTYNASGASSTWTSFSTGITTAGGFKKGLISVNGTGATPVLQGVLLNNGVLYNFFRASGASTITNTAVTITGGGTHYFSDLAGINQNTSGIFYAFDSVSKKVYKVAYASGTATTATATVFSNAVTQNINSIAMSSDGTRIIMVGNSGTILVKTGITTPPPPITFINKTNTVSPLPLNDITSTASGKIHAVGNDGTLWKTINSGVNWYLVNTGTANKLNALALNSTAVGLVAGNNGKVYAASNMLLSDATLTPIATTVTDNFTDVTIGISNKAYATTKAGNTIFIADYTIPVAVTTLASNVNGSLNGVTFKPAIASAYAVGNGTGIINYLATTGFVISDVFTQPYKGISFYDNNNGYVVDSGYVIRHTLNAGNNWSVVLPKTTLPVIYNVKATGINKAVVIGKTKYVAKIIGNNIPVNIALPTGVPASNFLDISFNQSGKGVIVGTNRVAVKINISGSSYYTVSIPSLPPVGFDFRSVHMFNNNNDSSFIAAGTAGNIYYHKVGTGFVKQSNYTAPLTTDMFNDIYFHDDRVGYVVGNSGRAYKCVLEKNIMEPGSPGLTTNAIVWDELCPLAIYNGLAPAQVHFNAFAFSSRTQGFFGGSFSPSLGVFQKHAVILNDESDLYSTRFWYDKLGRMVISQNTKQINKTPSAYSYTLYDELGRIKEVGEKFENASATKQKTIFGTNINGLFNLKAIDDAKLLLWVNDATGSRNEVTKTYYDATVITPLPFTQDNLRKRVSTVTYEDLFDGNDQTFQHASHYSYDIHGNVKTMLQDNPSLATLIVPQQFKRIDYDYDLISGKVNKVTYQPNERDQFIHRYSYDSDNRITVTETSSDNIVYDVDAKYFYYAHGPLARVEYGNNAVQGIDYAYTLQGWIKGVNSNTLNADRDMGKDGSDLIAGHPNKIFAKDAFGYTLNYFQGDYKQIDFIVWNNASKRFEATTHGSLLQGARNNLFNGNISSMITTVQEIDTTTLGNANAPTSKPLGNAYKYDQLNRIMSSQSYTNLTLANNDWENAGPFTANMYANSFTYDANGNILSQHQSDVAGAEYNAMQYKYRTDATGKLLQNRLYHVRDNTTYTGLQPDDIDDQGTFYPNPQDIKDLNNYSFDEIGNLRKDSTEQIAKIEWTVYGKIKRITRDPSSTKDNLVFEYDASGNRIAKHVYDGSNNWKYSTYYVRDAQGNVMSTYDKRIPSSGTGFSYKLLEQDIYGSSRIGLNYPDKEMQSNVTTALTLHVLGRKQFEMADHLGNVNTVISDRKIPVESSTPGTIAYYVADISSTSSYSAFGSMLKDRAFQDFKNFRFGYQGSEKDNEINGSGNSYTTQYRILDVRIGRWFSMDPKGMHGESPYSSMGNNPVWHNDILGDIFDKKSQPKVDEYKVQLAGRETEVNNSISTTKDLIKNSTDPSKTKELQSQLTDLQAQQTQVVNAKTEIAAMEKSPQLFKIGSTTGKESFTTYDKKDKAVVFNIASGAASKFASLGHEFKHGFQFLEGKLSFNNQNPPGPGQLYDLEDEEEAYKRQYALSPKTTLTQINENQVIYKVTNMEEIHYNVVREIDRKNGKEGYLGLPSAQDRRWGQATDIKVSKKNKIP